MTTYSKITKEIKKKREELYELLLDYTKWLQEGRNLSTSNRVFRMKKIVELFESSINKAIKEREKEILNILKVKFNNKSDVWQYIEKVYKNYIFDSKNTTPSVDKAIEAIREKSKLKLPSSEKDFARFIKEADEIDKKYGFISISLQKQGGEK